MTQKESLFSALVPIAIILAAFFFMEQYDLRVKDLKASKQDIIQEEEAIRHHILHNSQLEMDTEENSLQEELSGEESNPPPLHPSNRNSGHFLITNDIHSEKTTQPIIREVNTEVSGTDITDLGHYSKFISSQTTSGNIYHRGNQVAHISENDDTASVVNES